VSALAERLGLSLGAPADATAPASEPAALLAQCAALQPALAACGSLPPGLERFLRLGVLADRERTAELLRRLPRELSARADDHVAACDVLAARGGALAAFLDASVRAAVGELELEVPAPDGDERAQLDQRLRDACVEARRGVRGTLAAAWPLSASLASGIYSARVRPRLVRALLHHRCMCSQLPSAGAALPPPLGRLLEADRGLELLGTLISLDRLRQRAGSE
jgi:hypothetical protein